MKTTRKLLAMVLAVIMVMSLATTAFAAETGSITIENTTIGQTYAIYKVFDASYSENAVSYTFTKTESNTALYNALVAEDSPFTMTQNDGGNTYYVASAASAETISAWLKTKQSLLTKTAEKTASGGTVEFTGLDFGYYYITSSLGTVVTIDTVAPNATVIDKNDTVDVPEKEVDDTSVELGQVVTFTVTEKIDRYIGTEKVYSYTFTDVMSDGLTFNKDVKVKVGETEVTGLTVDYTSTTNGFVVTVPTYDTTNNAFLYEEGSVITLTYTATVNSNAVAQVEENKLDVDWTNDNGVKKDAGNDEEKVYSAKIVIDKIDGTNKETKLKGAKFVLYKEVDGAKKYYNLADNKVTWVDNIANATEVTTNENGEASFAGLEDGTYFLLETEAPLGYNVLTAPVEVTIAGSETDTTALTVTKTVQNNSGTELPSTGGMGTTMFYIFGGILVLAAVVLLVIKKRMATAE